MCGFVCTHLGREDANQMLLEEWILFCPFEDLQQFLSHVFDLKVLEDEDGISLLIICGNQAGKQSMPVARLDAVLARACVDHLSGPGG
jgi:hypothetical protein